MELSIEKYAPENLPFLPLEELQSLNKEDIIALGKEYPHMKGLLRIQAPNGKGVISPATYRSLGNLLRSGLTFIIVGTAFGDPQVKEEDIINEAAELAVQEFVAPPSPIFSSEEPVREVKKSPKRSSSRKPKK